MAGHGQPSLTKAAVASVAAVCCVLLVMNAGDDASPAEIRLAEPATPLVDEVLQAVADTESERILRDQAQVPEQTLLQDIPEEGFVQATVGLSHRGKSAMHAYSALTGSTLNNEVSQKSMEKRFTMRSMSTASLDAVSDVGGLSADEGGDSFDFEDDDERPVGSQDATLAQQKEELSNPLSSMAGSFLEKWGKDVAAKPKPKPKAKPKPPVCESKMWVKGHCLTLEEAKAAILEAKKQAKEIAVKNEANKKVLSEKHHKQEKAESMDRLASLTHNMVVQAAKEEEKEAQTHTLTAVEEEKEKEADRRRREQLANSEFEQAIHSVTTKSKDKAISHEMVEKDKLEEEEQYYEAMQAAGLAAPTAAPTPRPLTPDEIEDREEIEEDLEDDASKKNYATSVEALINHMTSNARQVSARDQQKHNYISAEKTMKMSLRQADKEARVEARIQAAKIAPTATAPHVSKGLSETGKQAAQRAMATLIHVTHKKVKKAPRKAIKAEDIFAISQAEQKAAQTKSERLKADKKAKEASQKDQKKIDAAKKKAAADLLQEKEDMKAKEILGKRQQKNNKSSEWEDLLESSHATQKKVVEDDDDEDDESTKALVEHMSHLTSMLPRRDPKEDAKATVHAKHMREHLTHKLNLIEDKKIKKKKAEEAAKAKKQAAKKAESHSADYYLNPEKYKERKNKEAKLNSQAHLSELNTNTLSQHMVKKATEVHQKKAKVDAKKLKAQAAAKHSKHAKELMHKSLVETSHAIMSKAHSAEKEEQEVPEVQVQDPSADRKRLLQNLMKATQKSHEQDHEAKAREQADEVDHKHQKKLEADRAAKKKQQLEEEEKQKANDTMEKAEKASMTDYEREKAEAKARHERMEKKTAQVMAEKKRRAKEEAEHLASIKKGKERAAKLMEDSLMTVSKAHEEDDDSDDAELGLLLHHKSQPELRHQDDMLTETKTAKQKLGPDPSHPNKDAAPVEKKMLSDMSKEVLKSMKQEKVDWAKKRYTKKEQAASTSTAKAATEASDAERGATAIANLGAKQDAKGKAQADAVWAQYKQQHPQAATKKVEQKAIKNLRMDGLKISNKNTKREAKAAKEAGKEYHKVVAQQLKKSKKHVNKKSGKSKDAVQRAAKHAVASALHHVTDAAISEGEGTNQAAAQAKKAVKHAANSDEAIEEDAEVLEELGLSAAKKASPKPKSGADIVHDSSHPNKDAAAVDKKMLSDMSKEVLDAVKKEKVDWAKKRYTKKEQAAAKAGATAAEKAHDAERGAAAISGVATGSEERGKVQADAIVAKMKANIKNGVLPKADAKKTSKAKVVAAKHEAKLHKEANKNAVAVAKGSKLLQDAVSVGERVDGIATEGFSTFFSKAQHHAESELEASTKALTGHASVTSIPAEQLKALARMAADELKKREHDKESLTPEVEEVQITHTSKPEKPMLVEHEEPVVQALVDVQTEDVSTPVKKVAVEQSVQQAPKKTTSMSTDAMAALIKASVAKALGHNGVQYDEKAVDSQLVQIQL